MTGRRMTLPTALILSAMASGTRYGFDVMDVTGLASGTVYPALRRLERQGFLNARWESAAVALEARRPRRRMYELSASGRELLPAAQHKLSSLPQLSTSDLLKPPGS